MYSIGQVLFVISSGTKTIEPIQVHSKQTLETMDGMTVQHMCATVDNKTISLEKHQEKGLLSGIFIKLDEAEEHLLHLASQMVKKLAESAKEKSGVFHAVEEEEVVTSAVSEKSDAAIISPVTTITLEDGTKANVHLPSELT